MGQEKEEKRNKKRSEIKCPLSALPFLVLVPKARWCRQEAKGNRTHTPDSKAWDTPPGDCARCGRQCSSLCSCCNKHSRPSKNCYFRGGVAPEKPTPGIGSTATVCTVLYLLYLQHLHHSRLTVRTQSTRSDRTLFWLP